jgi:signal transduction histidine kinase
MSSPSWSSNGTTARLGAIATAAQRGWRRQTLVKQFSLAASAVLILGMAMIGTWVADRIKTSVINNSAAAAALHMDSFVSPLVQELSRSRDLSPETSAKLETFISVLIGNRIVGMKVWTLDGTIVYSNWKELIGRRFPLTANFRSARDGSFKAELESHPHDISGAPKAADAPMLEIYAPIRNTATGQVVAVAEYYSIERELASELRQAMAWSWLVVGLVTLGMLSGLFGIVLTGSRTIEKQRMQLQGRIDDLNHLLAQNQDLRQRVQRAHHRSARINEQVLRRVGADLHDGPAQFVSLALLLLHSLKTEDGDAQRNEDLARIRAALSEAMSDIRALSSGLMLPDIGKTSLDEVVRLAVQAHVSRTGSRPSCELSLPPAQVPDSLKVCTYRFVQEALNNSFKHSQGTTPLVVAKGDDTSVVLSVSDHGPGLRRSSGRSDNEGLGLIGLRDRIETLGGQLEIEPGEDGFKLTARFDLDETRRLDSTDASHDQHSRR